MWRSAVAYLLNVQTRIQDTTLMSEHAVPASVVFTPEAVASINRAYAMAVDIIAEAQQEKLRTALAEYMMGLARSGERDEHRLCSLSVLAVLGRVPEPRPGLAAPCHTAGRG